MRAVIEVSEISQSHRVSPHVGIWASIIVIKFYRATFARSGKSNLRKRCEARIYFVFFISFRTWTSRRLPTHLPTFLPSSADYYDRLNSWSIPRCFEMNEEYRLIPASTRTWRIRKDQNAFIRRAAANLPTLSDKFRGLKRQFISCCQEFKRTHGGILLSQFYHDESWMRWKLFERRFEHLNMT